MTVEGGEARDGGGGTRGAARGRAPMSGAHTPASLAERWECSEAHVRNLIRRGELQAFKLGGKLLRIRPEEVERYECRDRSTPATESPRSEESSPLSGTKGASDFAAAFAPAIPPKPGLALVRSSPFENPPKSRSE